MLLKEERRRADEFPLLVAEFGIVMKVEERVESLNAGKIGLMMGTL